MNLRFLLGPAGSGKTWRCLAEIRAALAADPAGPPLIFLAPKQATFQLERQLLAQDGLAGFARLRIVSFQRLAEYVLAAAGEPQPNYLSDEGQVMIWRALLLRHETELRLYQRSARRAGFAQQLSRVMAELQQHQVGEATLRAWAAKTDLPGDLRDKLLDLATLLQAHRRWSAERHLQDASRLLDTATELLGNRRQPPLQLKVAHLWLDGFAEMTPQEIDLLMAMLPQCQAATLAFCLDPAAPAALDETSAAASWLSIWGAIGKLYRQCRERAAALPHAAITVEALPAAAQPTRFTASPALEFLAQGFSGQAASEIAGSAAADGIRLAVCPQPEDEAALAARAILQTVQAGGRFRDCAVLARNLDGCHKAIARAFRRYGIPFFLDRRESIAHHPLAELTRGALRAVSLDWRHEDWFGALKAGFSPVEEGQIDRLENEALARGWQGGKWREPLQINGDPGLQAWAEELRQKLVRPFEALARRFAARKMRPDGPALAAAIRELWRALKVERTLEAWAGASASHAAVHHTVREQMEAWLKNVELAFADEALPLRDWLPILEAGLATLTVGVIPPALDQVLVGAIDRARNPELKLTIVLGLNEGIFPAAPAPQPILSEDDRAALSQRALLLGPDLRERLARERFYGYIACTRSREKLLLAHSRHDSSGRALHPSPFIGLVRRLFPGIEIESYAEKIPWQDSLTAAELAPVIFPVASRAVPGTAWHELLAQPALTERLRRLAGLREPTAAEALSPALARELYGPALRTSVSRLEEFAACPFRFFVKSGLRAGERKLFEMDARERGNFQHEVLKLFHERLAAEHRRWRDLEPSEAREKIGAIGGELMADYRDGLFRESAGTLFAARAMTGMLQDFVEAVIVWLRRQYQFDPTLAEAAFDDKPGSRLPAWHIALGPDFPGLQLSLHGRIDRVDFWRDAGGETALAVVIDYKSGGKKLDALLVEHGIQLQLLAYLNVLRHWPSPDLWPGLRKIEPAGVFYINLRGIYDSAGTRAEVLAEAAENRLSAWRHTGRFDASRLGQLDQAGEADQFNYSRNKDGSLNKRSAEALPKEEFLALLDRVETQLIEMGRRIFSGAAAVDPYRKGSVTPCDYCDCQSICRIDPQTHQYRRLQAAKEP